MAAGDGLGDEVDLRPLPDLFRTISQTAANRESSYFRARAEVDVHIARMQVEATRAADQTAKSVRAATWVLAIATIVLAIATIVLVIVSRSA